MNAPKRPSFRFSLPSLQLGQMRGLEPSAGAGKMWCPRMASSVSMTCVMRSVFVPPIAAEKSVQKSASSFF
jgi:hypothetical protein